MSRETVAWVTSQPRALSALDELALGGDLPLLDDRLDEPLAFGLAHRRALVHTLRISCDEGDRPRCGQRARPPGDCVHRIHRLSREYANRLLGDGGRGAHATTLVPQPASVMISSSTACSTRPSMMWALPTPASSALRTAATLGTMPPPMRPAACSAPR